MDGVKKMTVMTPDEYRKKHKRCATCRYWLGYGNNCDYCKVKNIKKWRTDGKFCKTYEAIPFGDKQER